MINIYVGNIGKQSSCFGNCKTNQGICEADDDCSEGLNCVFNRKLAYGICNPGMQNYV